MLVDYNHHHSRPLAILYRARGSRTFLTPVLMINKAQLSKVTVRGGFSSSVPFEPDTSQHFLLRVTFGAAAESLSARPKYNRCTSQRDRRKTLPRTTPTPTPMWRAGNMLHNQGVAFRKGIPHYEWGCHKPGHAQTGVGRKNGPGQLEATHRAARKVEDNPCWLVLGRTVPDSMRLYARCHTL